VRLSYGSHELDLSVRNGPAPLLPPPTGDAGSGHGILGMRERAGLARGTITVGPTAEGWEVAARLPLVPASQWDDEAVVDPAPSS
jgi:signal transduction histidine kinase